MSTEQIGGDFELDRAKLLGKGAWGEVFIGKQISLNRPVAIKLLKKELTADPDFVRRFRREAECLAKLAEEHIIQVYSAGEYQGSHYFIMEYVQGTTLSKLIEKHRTFSAEEIAYVAESVAKALKSAWSSPAQIVHRDIKPANIMVSFSSSIIAPSPQADKQASLFITGLNLKDTQIKVMDFGLAKVVQKDDKQEATLVGTVIGTPKYISPEQGMGNPADVRSDMYSLGIVLYEMATGKIPFEGDSAVSMIRHHIYDTALMISNAVTDFPAELEAIIMKCIQKDPNTRYANPIQLLEDLDAFEKSKPLIHARVDHTRVSSTSADATMLLSSSAIRLQQRRKRRMIIVPTAFVGIIATALILWFGILGREQKTPPPPPPDTTQSQPANNVVTPTISSPPPIDNQAALAKEMERQERLRLSEAMITDTLKLIEDPKTKEQQKFNLIIQSIKSDDYEAARRETDKLMELEDDIIPPAATFLQMRIWNISQGKSYELEMKRLYDRFEAFYPKNDCFTLVKKLYEEACISAESNSVDEIIADADKENDLQQKVKVLDDFIKHNDANKFIQKVKDKLAGTYDEIKKAREANYKNTLALAEQQTQLNNFKEASALLDKAREYTDDFSEIDNLKVETEKTFLQFCEIEPITKERDANTQSFLQIKNIRDASEMLLIPAGEFIRGSDDSSANQNERPAMKVMLGPYYVDKFEITNEQFKKFVEANKYVTEAESAGYGWVYSDGILNQVKGACWKDPNGDGKGITDLLSHPVVQVSLKDAEIYAKWAKKRLLTEAEWEKAARSDKELTFPWGNEWRDMASNTSEAVHTTTPVGAYQQDKSPYGCYDIAGNVAEWCADYYDPMYYQSRITDNPKGPASGDCRLIRGGSWISSATEVRLTIRKGGFSPTQKSRTTSQFWTNYLGFRCATDILSLK